MILLDTLNTKIKKKTASGAKEKSNVSAGQYLMQQVDENNDSGVFKFGLQRLPAFCRYDRNVPYYTKKMLAKTKAGRIELVSTLKYQKE